MIYVAIGLMLLSIAWFLAMEYYRGRVATPVRVSAILKIVNPVVGILINAIALLIARE